MAGEGAAAQASSLRRWLSVYAANTNERCVVTVRRLLQTAFPGGNGRIEDESDWSDVVATIENFYEALLPVDAARFLSDEYLSVESNAALGAVLGLVLGVVVQCDAKDKFVRDILAMDDSVQADLMAIIEKVMARGVSMIEEVAVDGGQVEGEDKRSGRKEVEMEQDVDRSFGMGSPLHLSRNAALERANRENGILKEENVHLARGLEDANVKLREAGAEKVAFVETIQQLKEQLGVDTLRKERSLRALYDDRIQELQQELEAAKAEARDKTALASEVPRLRDEVDLLRPLVDKVAKMDSTMAKYKAKIDDLSGAKDSLRRAEDTNAELLEKNMALERGIIKAATWQRKLQEAKEANTAVEFRVSELESLLQRERQESAKDRFDLETAQSALWELQTLNTQLQGSVEHSAETGNHDFSLGPTIAGGISEFNPELIEKISRLEFENTELKKQVDGETSARIDGLLDDVEDLTRLKKSFEKKYFDTEQSLQSTQNELRHTKQQLESKVAEFEALVQMLSERQSHLEEDIAAHALDRQIFVCGRNRLETELRQIEEREEFLTRTLNTRDRLLELQGAKEALNSRNERLSRLCERLSMEQEDMVNKLQEKQQDHAFVIATQVERSAMQIEDANAGLQRFQMRKERETRQVCQQYEEQIADTISRMTLMVNKKSTEIEELKSKLHRDKLQHDEECFGLRVCMQTMEGEWLSKEEKISIRIKELEELCSRCNQQERKLKDTVKSQLESNKRLVAANQALKTGVAQKGTKIEQLESKTAVLESKMVSLEKERAHFTSQEKRKRGVENETSRVSSQLNTQVGLMASELEKVLKEKKELQQKLVGCRCGCEASPRSGVHDSGQKAKNYYVSRIEHLEHDKEVVERKRRELLLVNAKLIQEQKQVQVRNVSLSTEVEELKESVNRWLLHDERRKKQEELGCSRRESDRVPVLSKRGSASERRCSTGEDVQDATTLRPQPEAASRVPPARSSSSRSSEITRTFTSDRPPQRSESSPASASTRKRRLNDDHPTPEAAKQAGADTTSDNDFTDARAFFSSNPSAQSTPSSDKTSCSVRRPKRRLTHFITRSVASERQHTEKPSECHQQ